MNEREFLAERFEEHRPRLRAVAYRMLGSLSEADDAVRETWLKLGRTGRDGVDDLGGWLTTVVGRVCLSMLRSRPRRGEQPPDVHVPDPVVDGPDGMGTGYPEERARLAESASLALLAALETVSPAERLAFVLHDLLSLPFEDIAPLVGRGVPATRQLASRARRRVRGAEPPTDADLPTRCRVVDAFLTAAAGGDIAGLLTVLAPHVVLRSDDGPGRPGTVLRGARVVAGGAVAYARMTSGNHPLLVNGGPGAIGVAGGRVTSVASFTVAGGRIVAMTVLADPERIEALGLRPV
ncbi:sigma-70 family RNA polymerase sigma factor [Streptomyces sp. 3MP-14]|uniref:Sigma-70 family RNA polymerase sigma factor n=1 Tax=Streptomyces mimosae TaxID=2586635 RepID=A0A5N6AJI5_9ACTN|nr:MULTISPECIES: sigma-70 family RNA polymerase sigma factor [Streptomyces]KAB8168824.1 sigma-70 family RNA polymerase sigma factor [Streptomyces mimosae]KAB8177896.1 sigma-70 family RNA polymerase sigma factor [Streptomyces sp. 3MP-14]